MESNKRLVYIYELSPGMILLEDIKANGRVLIRRGVPVTQYAIDKLKEHYIPNQIEVYYGDGDYSYNNDREIEVHKTMDEVEESLNELTFDLEQIFRDMDVIKLSGIQEVRNFAAKIQEELKYLSSLIKNIVIYGSGSDVIYRHGVNVAVLSTILGKWIGLNGKELNLLTFAAVLHDFGKVKVAPEILDKPDKLTQDEYKQVKVHPEIGYKYIKEIPFLDRAVSYGVLMHHERMDGSGYPFGLREDNIHQFAKIISIADVFDAVNSNRRYKKSRGPFEALEIIKEESLGKLDYEYCCVFLNHVINYYMGENVRLNSKEICKIIQVDANNLARPLLLGDSDFIDLKQRKDLYIEELIL